MAVPQKRGRELVQQHLGGEQDADADPDGDRGAQRLRVPLSGQEQRRHELQRRRGAEHPDKADDHGAAAERDGERGRERELYRDGDRRGELPVAVPDERNRELVCQRTDGSEDCGAVCSSDRRAQRLPVPL